MSQDLFAAFSSLDVYDRPTKELYSRQASEPNAFHSDAGIGILIDDNVDTKHYKGQDDGDEDFGEFEDASAGLARPEDRPYPPASSNAAKSAVELTTSQRRGNAFARSKDSGPTVDTAEGSRASGSHPFAGHMDLLFSADDDDEYNAGADEITDLATNPEAAMAYSKRVIAEQMAGKHLPPGLASSGNSKQPTNVTSRVGRVTEVLFDLDAIGDDEPPDDSFGDFEAPVSHGLKDRSTPPDGKRAISETRQPTVQSVSSKNAVSARKEPLSEHATTSNTAMPLVDDDWDDFEEAAPVPTHAKQPGKTESSTKFPTRATHSNPPTTQPTSALPPTNIPPPHVLLSVFPSLFATAKETLLEPLSKLDAKQRQILLGHPATLQFLRKYINQAIVLGHIIAGRKLRWKRDQHLTQSMRIGPAAAAGKGGMKLAGIDKSEATKEDREVLDIIRLWRTQIGKLRTAAAGASTALAVSGTAGRLAAVPEIVEQMPVKALKTVEGGITAPHACALCGLRREERVAKVDVEVEDSFGEWWIEGMQMHLLCRDFWEEQKGRLKSK